MSRTEESKRRLAKLKQRRAEDPEFDAEWRRKKREEVAAYRDRLKRRRAEDPEFDAEYRRKKRVQRRRSKTRKAVEGRVGGESRLARLEAKLRELGFDPAEI